MTKTSDGQTQQERKNQMRKAIEIAARKVKKEPKGETDQEMFGRIREEKETKKNKSAKRAAKKMIKNKKVKSMDSYFVKK